MDKGKSQKMNRTVQSAGLLDIERAWSAMQKVVPMRRLQSEAEYREAVQLADGIVDSIGDDESHPLFSMLDLLTDIIAAWERNHVQIPDAPPKDVLRYLIDAHNLKYKDLEDIVSSTVLSDVLAGRRSISKAVAKGLAQRFNVSVEAFM